MNTSTSIHNTLNSGATVTRADNKRCYACHTNSTLSSDNVVNQIELPTSGHPDKYNIPKNCMDCHDKGNFSALIVKEHYSAGSDIKTKPYTNTNVSCVNCHNKTEMIIINNDPEGPKSEFARVSHYGNNKTGTSPYNAGGVSNCTLCHQGSSAFSTEMVNAAWNASIDNHSELGTNPGCTNVNCHKSGRIHDSTLTKPAIVLPNSSYCQVCHTTVQKHNGAVNCTQCHLSTNKNIHPVQYLQPSGIFLINSAPNKLSAVNCTSCHQATLSGFSSATQVKTPLSHSNDNGGSKWGSYWTSQKGACLYCHGNSKHNTSALGKAITAIGSDTIGGSIGTGTLCSSCHNSGDSNYAAIMNLLIPDPVANVPVSNYNYSSGTDHSSYGITDADCKPCHGSALSISPDMGEFPHNVATAAGCTACHGQPPIDLSGAIRNNTDGAHTLHKDAGYGNVPETSCEYCHYKGGINDNNGAKHPNGIYNVTTNTSASITTYTPNAASGSDDTCAGVSCHTNGLSSGAKAGTAVWNGSTAGACNVCHSTASSGIPSTGNHSTKHYNLSRGYQCATCHGTNADTGGQIGHKNNEIIDIAFTGIAASGTFDPLTNGCNLYCHSPNSYDAKPVPTWGGTTLGACGTACHSKPPARTRSGSTNAAHTGLTESSDCVVCHGPGANTGSQEGHVNGAVSGGTCTGCHINVGAASLGLHSSLNGTTAVDDGDCQTCHFGSFPMLNGSANSDNTLYCQDCHTSTSVSHGSVECKWCHAAGDQPDYRYHSNTAGAAQGPRGTATGANCGTCHTSNLMDEPFRAPGITHYDPVEECFYCHSPADKHTVGPRSDSSSPTLSVISVTSPITSGTPAKIQATVTDGIVMIAAAQYQVTNISGIIIPWTNMTALDGRFDSANEIVNSTLSTSNLIGTYTVSIKGMASAYKTDPSKPYYLLNGMWSSVGSTTLIVTQPRGYVNGTVRNGLNAIAGAIVSTSTGASSITDSNGNYSMNLVIGTYQLSARKDPEYYPGSSVGITIDTALPATQNFNLNKKQTGNIIGTIRII